jgi:transposase
MSTRKSRASRARDVALFRYSLIRPLADPALTATERGALVRELAHGVHVGPAGESVRVSRSTVDRWIRAWRVGGFDALIPPVRQVNPRTAADALELAASLKRERPTRTAAHIVRIIEASQGWAPSARTLQRHFVRLDLNRRPDGTMPEVFGRFEADAPGQAPTLGEVGVGITEAGVPADQDRQGEHHERRGSLHRGLHTTLGVPDTEKIFPILDRLLDAPPRGITGDDLLDRGDQVGGDQGQVPAPTAAEVTHQHQAHRGTCRLPHHRHGTSATRTVAVWP